MSLPPPPPPLPPAAEGAAPPSSGAVTHTTVYVGHLSLRTERRDVEELFEKYGRIISVELKHGGFAFVEYEDPRDADDAVTKLNGYELDGNRISVEWSRRSGGPGSGCFLCNQTGHWARDCPEASEKGLDVKSGKCFKCGEPGHLARFCSDYRRGPPSPPRYGRGRSPARYGGAGGRDPYEYGGYRGGRGYSRSPDRGYGGPSGAYRPRSPYRPGAYRGRSPSPYYRDAGRRRSPSPYGTLMTENNQQQDSMLKYSGGEDDFISPQEYKLRVGSAVRTLREELPLFFQQGLCTTSIYASNVRLIEASHTNVSLQGKPIYFLLAGAIRWSFKMWFRDIEFEIQSIRVNDRGSRGLKGMDSGSDFDDTAASSKMARCSSTSLATSLSRSSSSVSSSSSLLDLDLQRSRDVYRQKSSNGYNGLVKADNGSAATTGGGGGGGGEPPLPATTVTVRWTMKGTTRPSVVLTSSGPTSPPPSSYAGIFVYTFNDYGLIDEHRIENIMPSPSPEAIQRAFAWWGWLLSRTRPAATATSEESDTRKRLGLGCIVNK
ncbi:hypothetical protein BGZ70_006957 [Mortierella alpina]|uniref:Uncharacterized protein n=1 Tax=Mortierella alpina TaxID=64518 RepID=A0A9P6J7S3_MORAP|nr:hypothetical protein BGZ70_006957 [Mortierella alpina]